MIQNRKIEQKKSQSIISKIINLSMSQLRSSILAETQRIATKSRFGMFSIPPSIAIGDDSPYKQITHARGQDGKPVTKPRNLLAGTNRSGMGKKGYFGVPDSIYQGDKYADPFKVESDYDKKMHTRSTMHQVEFKPGNAYRTLAKSSYEYVEQKQNPEKKRRLNENGRVWTEPKNITTNQTSKVQRQFMKNPEYIADPYDRKKEAETKARQVWRSKLPEASWKFTASSITTFTKDKASYGIDDEAKRVLAQKKPPRSVVLKTLPHESSFVPVKKTGGNAIGKYPSAMSAQSLVTLRPRSITQKEKDNWRPNNGLTKSKPTPSISLNRKNINIGRYK